MLLLSLEGLYEATSLQLRVFFQEDRALKSSRPARVNKQGGSGFTEKLLVRMPSRKYEHNCQKSRCKDFGGSQICQHNRIRSTCKECLGSSICPHKREKSMCKECGGSQICQHSRRRRKCKECLGSGICPHKRRRNDCKECGGSSICEYDH